MKAFRILILFMGVLFPVISGQWDPVPAEICNRVVAIVNDDVITLYELNTKMKELTGMDPAALKMRDEDKYLKARQSILDLLINEELASQKIQELKIKITPQDVDAAVERVKKAHGLTQEELLANLKKEGVSYEKYRERIRGELERVQLLNFEVKSKIIVSDEKVRQYYEEHKDEFTSDETVRLATIFLSQKPGEGENALRRKAEEILSRLREGADFGALAKEFSDGPGAEEGGDLGEFKVAQLDPKLKAVIENLQSGQVSDPILRPSGLQLIKVVERYGGGLRPFEEVRDMVDEILYRKEVEKKYSAWIEELRKQAYTKIIF